MESENIITENTTEEQVAARSGREMRGPIAQNADGTSTQNSNNTSTQTPPTRPDGSTDGEMPETPPTEGMAPEMCDENDEDCEMPEPPDGFDGSMQGGPGNMGGGFPGNTQTSTTQATENNSSNVLHPVGYLTLGGGSVILAIIISYACFSKCFRKSPGETFATLKRFLLFVGVAVIGAAALITLCYFVPIWVA